jgi:hypothetical protein
LDSDQAVAGNDTAAGEQFSQAYRGSDAGSNSGSSGGSGGNGGGTGNGVGGEGGKVGSGDGGAHAGSSAGRLMPPSDRSNADDQPSAGGLEADWWSFNGVYKPGLR